MFECRADPIRAIALDLPPATRNHRDMSRWEIRLAIGLMGLFTVSTIPQIAQGTTFTAATEVTASSALSTLAVKGRAPKTGYDRDALFGDWADPDGNGCDARNDVLARDLTNKVFGTGRDKCLVLSGTLLDPYSGKKIDFTRGQGTSTLVPIDHVVAVSDAWQKGAFKWDAVTRVQFYNDPLNLKATQQSLNSQKRDGDAATWLPPLKSYRCAYVAQQIAVKAKYLIWVTKAEKEAMARILTACPKQVLPS
jgi:Protein of unknown function (DUF1524)